MIRRVLTALLGLTFALSVGLSPAQAAAMSVDMSLGTAGSHDCPDCAGGADKDGGKSAPCVQSCLPALAAVLPSAPALLMTRGAAVIAAGQRLSFGVTSAPLPAPPKA